MNITHEYRLQAQQEILKKYAQEVAELAMQMELQNRLEQTAAALASELPTKHISQIRILRTAFGLSLREAKDIIDRYNEKHPLWEPIRPATDDGSDDLPF